MRIFSIAFYFLFLSFNLCAQDDRGGQISNKFIVHNTIQTWVDLWGDRLCCFHVNSMVEKDDDQELGDTVIIELPDTNNIVLNWDYLNNYGGYNGYGQLELVDTVQWYRNDTLLDPQYYSSFYFEINSDRWAGSTLSTRKLGAYQLRYVGEQTNLPVVVIRKKQELLPEVEIDEEMSNLDIFPNPSVDYFNIQHGDISEGIVEIYSLQGKLLKFSMLNHFARTTKIHFNDFSSGTYIVKVITDQNPTFTTKILKL